MCKETNTDGVLTLPALPLKNTVLFPSLFLPLSVGRPRTLAAVEAALADEEKMLVVVAQKDAATDEPGVADLYAVGTRAVVKKMARGDGTVELLVQGVERVAVLRAEETEPYLKLRVRPLPAPTDAGTEVEALYGAVLELAVRALELTRGPGEVNAAQLAVQAGDPMRLSCLVASMLGLDVTKEQAILEATTNLEALGLAHTHLSHEVQVQELRHKINTQVRTELDKQQRDYVLRQQMQAIQEELGETTPEKAEVQELRRRLTEADLPALVRKEAEKNLTRLERLPAVAPDFQVLRSHLELVLELPWTKASEDRLDLVAARDVLDEDHYGLAEIKERILEHLAVRKLNPTARAPILCLVGPPGVGKTSLGQSIARALGRTFERLSLGGLHDESELRGHRRTYIGAMPGRLIQAVRRAGVNNPVLLLDEIDKLGRDFRGDPAAALLEVLDPAQNHTFRDNYLDLPFDLSRVLFLTTANTLDSVPRPLLDRMEVLRLAGYSEEEKRQIARRFLLPRQLQEAGVSAEQLTVSDDALDRIIARYTREAGVRELERSLGRLTRKASPQFAEGRTEPIAVTPAEVPTFLGPERFRHEAARRELPVGVSTGLAWTEAGGEVLYVEATLLPGGKGQRLTGQLGDVMRESARAAQSYIWAHADELGVDRSLFRTNGLHVHVPAGAVPKDGPSAGVAMATALASLYGDRPARRDTAMTGEITLSGLVLPVGGIKEKVLAARRAGLTRVVLPRSNEADLHDLPEHVRAEMDIVLVDRVEDALAETVPGLTMTAAPPRRGGIGFGVPLN